jgi:eukaryotic-like serine/threonine-protein kinase
MNPQVVLTIVSGSRKGTTQTFDRPGTYSIGREEQRQMAFPDNSEHHNISRHHCDLQITTIDPPNITIIDCNSTHGTVHNGRNINQPTPVNDRDIISIGDIGIQVQLTNITPISPPAKTAFSPPPINPSPLPPKIVQAGKQLVPKFMGAIKDFLEISPPAVPIPPTPENPTPIVPLQFQDYELGEMLGQGSFSEVYKAIHRQSGRQVALKILQPDVAKQDEAIQKFIREIDNTKVLDHPHVVKLLDFRYHQGAFFYTTEYCEAGSLFGLTQQMGGKLPVDWAKLVIEQILDGLIYTHQVEIPSVRLADGGFGRGQGLVHRSLKPENILLTQSQGKLVVKISDFALSKSFGSGGLTVAPGSFAGTPSYMSRSQLINYQAAPPAVDLWAAVACFYEMLTGCPPREFGDRDPTQVILNNDAVPILQRIPGNVISPNLATVIDRALSEQKDHSTFYQTAQSLKDDLLAVW